MQCLAWQRTEVLDQKTMSARRENAAADLVPRQFLALEHDRFEPGIHQPLGGGCGGKARADNDDVDVPHQ
jgi:hypothetical protein